MFALFTIDESSTTLRGVFTTAAGADSLIEEIRTRENLTAEHGYRSVREVAEAAEGPGESYEVALYKDNVDGGQILFDDEQVPSLVFFVADVNADQEVLVEVV